MSAKKQKVISIPLISVLILILLIFAGSAYSADIYVDGIMGLDSNSGLDWLHAKETITAGLALSDTAPGKDTVHVAEGTYIENIELVTFTSLLGGYPTGGAGGRDPDVFITVIDGSSVPLPVVIGANFAEIDGFTIKSGSGYVISVTPAVEICGGGIFCDGTSPHIANNVIKGNYVTGPSASYDFPGTVMGAGIGCISSTAIIENNIIEKNFLTGDSALYGGSAHGGGIYCSKSSITIKNNLISENFVNGGEGLETGYFGGAGKGGGIYISESNATISGNSIKNNSAKGGGNYGGGSYMSAMGGGICLELDSGNTVTINQNTILSNKVEGGMGSGTGDCGEGAGIYSIRSGSGTGVTSIFNNLIGKNKVIESEPYRICNDLGGGLCTEGVVVNNTIYENDAEHGGGAGTKGASAMFINNIFVNNVNYAISTKRYYSASFEPAIVHNNDFFNNTTGIYWSETMIFTDVATMNSLLSFCTDNISCSPDFFGSSEYRLSSSSCCIDTGTFYLAPSVDYDGDTRPAGITLDIGADEYVSFPVPLSSGNMLSIMIALMSILMISFVSILK